MANNKQMESKIYNLVSCLADNFGFDPDTAFEHARWETDVDHVAEILKMLSPISEKGAAPVKVAAKEEDGESEAPTESSGGDVADKIAACRKNIALWEKKLKDGKAKDADKQIEKIDKEKAKLAKLEAKSPGSVKTVETKKSEPVKDDKEKRIKRMSPVMAGQLKKALEDAGLEFGDKLKKEFVQYVDDLTDGDFKKVGLADHMRDFAKLKAPVKEEKPESEDDESEEDEEKVVPQQPASNVAGGGPDTVLLSLKELQSLEMTASVEPVGTFWDADNGRFVKGPEEDADEDFEDFEFDGKKYCVGEMTGRLYTPIVKPDGTTGDFFAGFIGVGKFKSMKKPE